MLPLMHYMDLLRNLGFDRDPFATTNADEEELLEDYFIEPPFFRAVYGDIRNPKSNIVFAPRGGGKTALKRRIELFSRTDAFLCVTYNSFPTAGLSLDQIDQKYHLENISRLLTVAVLSATTARGIDQITSEDRHYLYLMAKAHLSGLSISALSEAVSAVKNLPDRAKDIWNQITGPVGIAINALLVHFGFKPVEISRFQEVNTEIGDFPAQIAFLGRLARAYGYQSTYLLVDKVDENPLTGNKASSSLAFITPILTDLQLLEMKDIALKLFLWDRLEDEARAITRPDRVKSYALQWSRPQLEQMLSKRLLAHSNHRVHNLKSIASMQREIDLDHLVITLSGGSPRNIIRICKAIVDQQSELDPNATSISERAVLAGIEVIASELANEIAGAVLKDLKKLKRADFTVRQLYADIFKISQQAGLQKVQSWLNFGAVMKIGDRQETRGSRPSYVYGVSSPIVLKSIFSDMDAVDFWRNKIRFCDCGELLLRDWDVSEEHSCHVCQRKSAQPQI